MVGFALATFLLVTVWVSLTLNVTGQLVPPKRAAEQRVQHQAPRVHRGLVAIERGLIAYTDEHGAMPEGPAVLAPAYTFWPADRGPTTWSFGTGAGPADENAWVCLAGTVDEELGEAMRRARREMDEHPYVVAASCGAQTNMALPTTWPHQLAATYWVDLPGLRAAPENSRWHCILRVFGLCLLWGW